MNHSAIRQAFYSYFVKNKHQKVLSSPLIPAKDPSLLFTNAGMNQFKGLFLQQEKRDYCRAVSIQKCMRVSGKHNDFDEVGRTDYHHTFFEMLGNFSFGDYFKEQAIVYAWELLTSHLHLPAEKLWITVFREDEEAFRIWQEKIGIPAHKIQRREEKDNFWQMGETGPCGPCSEIYFDRGAAFGPDEFSDGNCRYIEIWNLVFMQYFRDQDGSQRPLPVPAIDTGMGMERLAAVLQGVPSNYQTDLFQPIINCTAELAGVSPQDEKNQVDLKVIADHIRALTFLIADGVTPANEGRGYVLRRILRRAVKHGKALGINMPFLHRVCPAVIQIMKPFYPELEHNREFIQNMIAAEEERFQRTLANGLKMFDEIMQTAVAKGWPSIPGQDLFRLSDTYGFPIDFARDLAREKNLAIDGAGFQAELELQKNRSRQDQKEKRRKSQTLPGIDNQVTAFTGYQELEGEATLLAIYVNNKAAQHLEQGQTALLVFSATPFYAESGGQVGDSGWAKNEDAFLNIRTTNKTASGTIWHEATLENGTLRVGDRLRLEVNRELRQRTAIHHTATHLLHAALREVLGLHVKQAGSYVGPDKLRFDYTHFRAPSSQELARVETLVNQQIRANLVVGQEVQEYQEAIRSGAMAIFEEKYGDQVRVVSVGDFSRELCGGTHLQSSGEIGLFLIQSESSISAGTRRIEALAGEPAWEYVQAQSALLRHLEKSLKLKAEQIPAQMENLERRLRESEKHSQKAAATNQSADLASILATVKLIKAVPTVVTFITDANQKQLGELADRIKEKIHGLAICYSNNDGKSVMAVSIPPELSATFSANHIAKKIAPLLNGKGGGRSDFAQAGGEVITDTAAMKEKITQLLEEA